MHYCDRNFKTKKALKEAVAARLAFLEASKMVHNNPMTVGAVIAAKVPIAPPVTVHNPETFSGEAPTPANGRVCVGGPHYPEPHKWYATVILKDGEVVKVS